VVTKQKMKNYTEPKLHDFDGQLEKRWYIEYHFRNPETKKLTPFREWVSSTHKTRGERYEVAKKQLDRLGNNLVLGFNPFRKEKICTTLCEAIKHVCDLKTQSNGKRTKTAYNSATKKFTDWIKANHYGDIQAKELSLPIGLMYFDNMLINLKVKPRTYNNNLATLRTLFNELEYRSYVNVNIFNKIRKLPKKKPDLKFFTPEEKKIIYNALKDKNPRLLLAAYLVYYCMIRPAEIVRLRFSHLNFEKSYIMLPPSISKKSSGTVLMPSYVKELLLSLGYDKQNSDWYIFSNNKELTPGEKEIAPTRIAEVWKLEIKDVYKIKHGIYTLKHTTNGELFEAGADARSIQLQNRHASLEYTQVYAERFSNLPSEKLNSFYRPLAG
jgi:integrase/recombinase XerD